MEKSSKPVKAPHSYPVIYSPFFPSHSSVHPGLCPPVHKGAQVPGCLARPQRHAALWGQWPGRHQLRLAPWRTASAKQREALPGGKQPQVHRCGSAAGRRQLCLRRGECSYGRVSPLHQCRLQYQVWVFHLFICKEKKASWEKIACWQVFIMATRAASSFWI